MQRRSADGIGMTSLRTRTRMVERLRDQGVLDEAVLAAMRSVPRHLFVDEALATRAYDDVSLPINYGQTISRPYTVARMLEILNEVKPLQRVLEVGTGCGYQAAVLAQLYPQVYSLERIQPLYARARAQLQQLGISNVEVFHEDGNLGLLEAAPFDGIILAAAAPDIPHELCQQLVVGGRMVLPVGEQEQFLYVIERLADGFRETKLESAKFVPLLMGKSQD